MMHALFTRSILALTLGSIVACGGGTTFSSGVEGSKKLSEIDEADSAKICAAAEATTKEWAADNKEGLCKFAGGLGGSIAMAFGQDGAAACEMAVTECLAKEPEAESSTCSPRDDNCDATVEEVETCYNDALEAFSTVMDDAAGKSCADLVMNASTLAVDNPASCKAIADRCPTADFALPSVGSSTTS